MRALLLACLFIARPAWLAAEEKPPATYAIPLPPKPDFSTLDWLVGEWTGQTTGRSPKADIQLAVTLALEKRFMLLQEEVTFTEAKTGSVTSESWMGILGAGRSGTGFVLWSFSSTGFITRYGVTVEAAGIHFNPEGGPEVPAGWLFRRLLQRVTVNEMTETVQAAPPGKPFFEYYTAKLTRKTPPE